METDCKADLLCHTLANVRETAADVKTETLRSTLGAMKAEDLGVSLVECLEKIAPKILSDNWPM